MVDLLKKNWQYLVIAALAALLTYHYLRPTPTGPAPVSKKQEKQIKADLSKKAETINAATAAADRANAASDAATSQGHAAAARAQANRITTHRKPHASPTPTAIPDTAAERIRRALTNY